MSNECYTFQRRNVCETDVWDFIKRYDPHRFEKVQLRKYFGTLTIRFEGCDEADLLFTAETPRRFFRTLAHQWPWAGYFLRLSPITAKSTVEESADADVFLALALSQCPIERKRCRQIETCSMVVTSERISSFIESAKAAAATLGKLVEIDDESIAHRQQILARTLQNYLARQLG